MANSKRDRNGYRKELGLHKLNYSDLLAIEKLLWTYADAREMKWAGVTEIPEGREHMPRATVDRYAFMGRYRPFHFSFGWNEFGIHFAGVDWIYREDSIKFLKERGYPKRKRYVELAAWPGIKVTFTPLSTTLYAQTHYATGKELKVMRQVCASIQDFISQKESSYLNSLSLNR